MATKLIKPVKRELLRADYRGRTVIAELQPGDVCEFRIKGSRKRYSIGLGHCFMLAQIAQYESDYREKVKRYKERKKLGLSARKPKRASVPFSPIYFKALSERG